MKDPAFLFYTKDFISGTQHMSNEELGAYLRLLMYQHQHGSIPNQKDRMMRITSIFTFEDFDRIWEVIQDKFTIMDNHLVNERLSEEVAKRAAGKIKKIASACLAGLISSSTISSEEKQKIKKQFDLQRFIKFEEEEMKEKIREWFYGMVNQMVNNNANANANAIVNINIDENINKKINEIENEKISENFPFPKKSLPEFKDEMEDLRKHIVSKGAEKKHIIGNIPNLPELVKNIDSVLEMNSKEVTNENRMKYVTTVFSKMSDFHSKNFSVLYWARNFNQVHQSLKAKKNQIENSHLADYGYE